MSAELEGRERLAAMIHSHMSTTRGAASALARKCGVTPACIGGILSASKGGSPTLLERIGGALGADDATIDMWLALSGHVAPDIAAALVAHPERWSEVRALFAGGDRG